MNFCILTIYLKKEFQTYMLKKYNDKHYETLCIQNRSRQTF